MGGVASQEGGVSQQGQGVLHDNDDDAHVTPLGRFAIRLTVALGLKKDTKTPTAKQGRCVRDIRQGTSVQGFLAGSSNCDKGHSVFHSLVTEEELMRSECKDFQHKQDQPHPPGSSNPSNCCNHFIEVTINSIDNGDKLSFLQFHFTFLVGSANPSLPQEDPLPVSSVFIRIGQKLLDWGCEYNSFLPFFIFLSQPR